MNFLPQQTKEKIEGYYKKDREKGLNLNKTRYLQFLQLLSLHENQGLYKKLGFRNAGEFSSTKTELNDLRNCVMHSKPLVTRKHKRHPTLTAKLDLLLHFENRIP